MTICYFAKLLQSLKISLFACFFGYLQRNSKTTAQIVIKLSVSIRTVTREN